MAATNRRTDPGRGRGRRGRAPSVPVRRVARARCVAALLVLASCGGGVLASCGGGGGAPTALVLVEPSPLPGGEPLLLNDDLRLTFSMPIDATTVTRRSVELVDVDTGLPAMGSWDVDGRRLRFRPDGVRSADLADGGYRPGATYRLTVTGFPFLGALRTPDGDALARSISLTYEVVAAGARPGVRLLRDASPGRTAPLRVLPSDRGSADTRPLPWDAPLRLACDEPIDPRSLDAADFEIRDLQVPDAPIPIARIELEDNRAEDVGASSASPGARLIVVPGASLDVDIGRIEGFEFRLRPNRTGPTDFSGGPAMRSFRPIRFYAARRSTRPAEREDSYEFDFADDVDFFPMFDPTSDGTARWSGNGRVEVRYPAAAGSGRDGPTELAGDEVRADVSATRLSIAADETVRLTGEGLVVLRAQGRIDLRGRLERPAPSRDPLPMFASGRRLFPSSAKDAETLSAWLRRARESDEPWTVIIAGGDLVVSGSIDVETPLLLVAGGRIRGSGAPRATDGQLWILGDGGGFELPHYTDPQADPNVRPPLRIDEPLANPLVAPVTYVAISSPVPKGRRPSAWLAPVVLGGRGSAGEFRVQFLGAGAVSGGEEGLGQAVRYDEPNLVVDPDSPGGAPVRLRIELVVRPGIGAWDPPYVDRVVLPWRPDR